MRCALIILPPRLRPGDTIGIVSPSWGGAGLVPHRVELGVRQMETLGYRVKFGAHALNSRGFVSDTPENRAADLHDLFADPGVRAIVAAIGGDSACHLLPLLDFDRIRRSPKIFMGYSDITVLNVAIHNETGLVTFNGPALLPDFAEYPRMFSYTLESMQKTITRAEPVGPVDPSPEWTEEFLDWGKKKDLERPRIMQPSPGWTWLRSGTAEGPLLGGCLSSLQHLRGTRFWPAWQGVVFFWETSEDKPPLEVVDSTLMDYENMGVLGQISGMLVGRAMGYSDEEKNELNKIILERTGKYHFPIITGMDFGHTAPQMTLPLGVRARIDSKNKIFSLIEPAVT